jgi:NitT/TauT family transport system ATP-binding protein
MGIELEKVNLTLDGLPILQDFSLALPETGSICLSGPSGCGKTSLLHILAGLHRPHGGYIRGLQERRISMLFQEDRLLPWLSAAQNVALVLPGGRAEEAWPWLELVELRAEAAQLPRELSRRMRRRVALARALAFEGDILLLDEPTAGLDSALARRIMSRIRERYTRRLLLTVTHDRALAAYHITRIELSGPPLQVTAVHQN